MARFLREQLEQKLPQLNGSTAGQHRRLYHWLSDGSTSRKVSIDVTIVMYAVVVVIIIIVIGDVEMIVVNV